MIEVYCDESRPETIFGTNSSDRYMVLGGIWVPRSFRDELKQKLKHLKAIHNLHGEIKWKNVSPSKLDFYLDLVNLFFESQVVRFRGIVIDSWEVDINQYHDSDSELGFYKFYYQLLKHWIDPREQYWVYLDAKKNKLPNRLHTLREVLNRSTVGNVINVQAIESKQSLLIQMSDVLIGAVGYRYHDLQTSDAKLNVMHQVERYIGHKIHSTTLGATKFNIFKIELRG